MKVLNLVDESKSDIKYKVSKFPDGQQNITIITNLVGSKFVPSHPWTIKSRLNNWLDLELITCTVASLRELKVKEIHLYVPYILGARSDRKFEEGGNNYLKDVICPAVNLLNLDSVTCLDPHSNCLEMGIKGFRKEYNINLAWFAFKEIYGIGAVGPFTNSNFILISPDAGASHKIYKLAEQIGYKGDIITCSKERDENGKLTKTTVPLTKTTLGKDMIIIDDICDGGATFINIAKEIKKQFGDLYTGKIYLIVTHGIFSKGFSELKKYFDGIYCTNSYSNITPDLLKHSMTDLGFVDKNVKQLNIF